MLAVFIIALAIWIAITIAAIIMIPGSAESAHKRYIVTRFCPHCGHETAYDLNHCDHCHEQLVCEIPPHHDMHKHAVK